MKRRTFLFIICCACLAGLWGIAQTAAAQGSEEQRREDVQTADKKLKQLDRKMDELAAGARKKEQQIRDEMNRMYDEFKKGQTKAHRQLEEMRKATNETWDKAKERMDKAIEELNGIYERARSKGQEKEAPRDKTL
jgi:signal transduction histidine kinase